MYSYIKGELVEKKDGTIVVDNHGIGYNISVSDATVEALPSVGTDVKIYTYTYVREDALGLFGFLTHDDLEMFRLLLTVNGIGPKGALAVLSVLSVDELRFCIIGEDVKKIEKVPGIGKKTAQRLIIDLKDKVDVDKLLSPDEATDVTESTNTNGSVRNEAVMALTALGYASSEALHVLKDIVITDDMDVEAVLKEALKKMAML